MKRTKIKLAGLIGALVCFLLMAGCESNNMSNFLKPETPAPPTIKSGKQAAISNPNEPNKVFNFVEKMPSFPGGEQALMNYLQDHIVYPKTAREYGIQGTVVVQFVVNKDGTLSNIKTIGTPKGGGLEKESINVVQNMPNWIAGTQNGKKVNVKYSLPVRYVLQ